MLRSAVLKRVSCFELVGSELESVSVSEAADLRLVVARLLLGSRRLAGTKCSGWFRFEGGCWQQVASFRLLGTT